MQEPSIKPFKGIRFNWEKTGEIDSCVCPPYDVISDPTPYYNKSKFNAIRLELPQEHPPLDKYETAKETLEQWIQKGILILDSQDTVYIYEQEFEVDHKLFFRRGFIALNRIEQKRMLTHEETRKKAKEDRIKMMSSLKTSTSFVFGLYEDKKQNIESILTEAPKELLYNFVDEESIINRFYKMTDRNYINALSSAMDQKIIYIADGHHRLNVSYRLGLSYIPVFLTNMYSSGIIILPYHRMIKYKNPKNIDCILNNLKKYTEIEKLPFENDNSLIMALERIAQSVRPSYLLYAKDVPGSIYMLKANDSILMDSTMHNSLRKLKVNILHTGLLKEILKISDDEIEFTQDSRDLINYVKKGDYDLALLLPPTTVEEVKDIADHSLYMPPKSTYFHPKILTGLVFYQYE